jgi:hypothetical protein
MGLSPTGDGAMYMYMWWYGGRRFCWFEIWLSLAMLGVTWLIHGLK